MICLAVAALCFSLVSGSFHLDPVTKRFIDTSGRERYFHGLNVVYKSAPYLPLFPAYDPQLSFSEVDMQYFQDWGLNIIRLGMMWPGAEPQHSQFNMTYLRQARLIVDTAGQYNITTLLDAHQDCLALMYCGEGAPDWAVTLPDNATLASFPSPFGAPFARTPSGIPTPEDCGKYSWSDYQATFAGAASYQQLYDSAATNPAGQREHFGAFWRQVASVFESDDNIIGYELINEPFAGDVWKDLLLWLPWVADQTNLQPFYDSVAAALRTADDRADHLVFFEPVTWSGLPLLNNVTVGFSHAPAGPTQANHSALAFHYYSPPNIGNQSDYFERRVEAASHLNVGALVTEFDVSDDVATMTSTMDVMDEHLLSWIGWEYKSFAGSTVNGTCTGCGIGPIYPNGTLDMGMISALSRTYAQAVAGVAQSTSFSSTTYAFSLVFTQNPSLSAPTEIYFNQALHYPAGYSCTVAPAAAAKCVLARKNMLQVLAAPGAATTVTVTIVATP